MFLTKTELNSLTGYHYKSFQIKWLRNHGYKFDIAANGSPIVLKIHVEDILRGRQTKGKSLSEPNFHSIT